MEIDFHRDQTDDGHQKIDPMAALRILRGARDSWSVLRDTFREFQQNDPLRMAAATSFFTSFALPPILIILIQLLGLFEDQHAIRRGLFEQLSRATDRNIVLQIRVILRNVNLLSLNPGMKTAGFIFLLFVATTLFEVIKNSMNQLWKIRPRGHRGFLFLLLYRVKSVGIIVIAGVLFSIALLGDTRGWALRGRGGGFIYHAAALLAATSWFILILKYLSDGRPAWKEAVAGGMFTGLLFMMGEVLLHLVFSYNKVKAIYGASTSLVLLLLFVFYCAFIFYYGACFTAVLGRRFGRPIVPTRHAMGYTLKGLAQDRLK
jgi:membrane protein